MSTLPESIALERDNCQRLVCEFGRLGSLGAFGAALIQDVMARADRAVKGGGPEAMQIALDELRDAAALRCRPRRLLDRGHASNASPYSMYANAGRS